MDKRVADQDPAPARAAGFTLVEVLAALVIVALGMLGVIEAVTQSARNGTYLREKTLAHWIAMNIVTEQRLQVAPPPVAESSDNLEFAGERWHWTMKVSQTQVQSMRRIDVSVRRADAPDDSSPLAAVAGFYGTAIVPAGGAAVSWQGSGEAANDDGQGREGGQDPTGGKGPGRPRKPRPDPSPDDDE